jgi:hypothetical protein
MPFDLTQSGSLTRAVLLDGSGRELLPSSQTEERDDGLDIPHPITFAALYRGAAYTYYHLWDEAMRHSRQNALAMRRDAWLMALLRERADETLSKKWHLEPDNPKDPWQKTVADGVTKVVKGIRRFNRMRRYLLQGGLWYGRYGANLKWVWRDMYLPAMKTSGPATPGMTAAPTFAKGRVLTLAKHMPVNGDKINFHQDDTPYVMVNSAFAGKLHGSPEIIYPTGAGSAAVLLRGTWRERVLIHSCNPDDADFFEAEFGARVHGVGMRDQIYWLDFLRRDYFGAVTEMLNRIGLGLVVIKYDQSNASAREVAEGMAKKYSRRSIIVMPVTPDKLQAEGGIEVIETPMAGAQVMLELQSHVEGQIERYMIGQGLSSGQGKSNPFQGDGQEEFAQDTKTKLCLGDADEFDETLTGCEEEFGLIETVKKHTYSYADFPLRYVTDHEQDDKGEKLKNVEISCGLGVSFGEKDVRELTGLPAPQEGEPTIGGKEALAAQQEADAAGAFGGANGEAGAGTETPDEGEQAPKKIEEKPQQYADESPIIPYHSELTVSALLDRIRKLGAGPQSRDTLRRLREMLNKNPHLRRELEGKDIAFLQALGDLEMEQKYSEDQPRVPAGSPEGGQWIKDFMPPEQEKIVWRVHPQGAKLHGTKSRTSNEDELKGVMVFDSLNDLAAIDWANEDNVELVKIRIKDGDTFTTHDQEGQGLRSGKGKIIASKKFADTRTIQRWAEHQQKTGWTGQHFEHEETKAKQEPVKEAEPFEKSFADFQKDHPKASREMHANVIQHAISRGETVPDSVLAEYPDVNFKPYSSTQFMFKPK